MLTDALGGVLGDVGVSMLTDIEVVVEAPTVITVEFAPTVSQGVDVLSAVAVDVLIKALTDALADTMMASVVIGVDLLADKNVNF